MKKGMIIFIILLSIFFIPKLSNVTADNIDLLDNITYLDTVQVIAGYYAGFIGHVADKNGLEYYVGLTIPAKTISRQQDTYEKYVWIPVNNLKIIDKVSRYKNNILY
jgi:hypothetical protein